MAYSTISLSARLRKDSVTDGERTCTSCGVTKPFSEFYKNRGSQTGVTSRCKACTYPASPLRAHARHQICRRCKESKLLEEFHTSAETRTGRRHVCIPCFWESLKESREKRTRTNPEKRAAFIKNAVDKANAAKASGMCPRCFKNKPSEGNVRCDECKEKIRLRDLKKRRLKRELRLCVVCGQRTDGELKNCKRCRRKQRRKEWVKNVSRIRERVFKKYGEICACCGFEDKRFLTIDHIYNDGKKDRKGGSYRKYLRENRADLQTLCWNCNLAKQKFRGVCPHKILAEGKEWNMISA